MSTTIVCTGCNIGDRPPYALGVHTGPTHNLGEHRSVTVHRNLTHENAHAIADEMTAHEGRYHKVTIYFDRCAPPPMRWR